MAALIFPKGLLGAMKRHKAMSLPDLRLGIPLLGVTAKVLGKFSPAELPAQQFVVHLPTFRVQ